MLPVLECADVTDKEGGRHYWVFNVNLRDRRFEVLDSSRTLDNIELMTTASTIAGTVRQLWRKHYPKFSIEHLQIIDIDVPKQSASKTISMAFFSISYHQFVVFKFF